MIKTTTVKAEEAPIGVQLWPTLTPASAPNFTLERVSITRVAYRTYVTWVYESGKERHFQFGETVFVSFDQEEIK